MNAMTHSMNDVFFGAEKSVRELPQAEGYDSMMISLNTTIAFEDDVLDTTLAGLDLLSWDHVLVSGNILPSCDVPIPNAKCDERHQMPQSQNGTEGYSYSTGQSSSHQSQQKAKCVSI